MHINRQILYAGLIRFIDSYYSSHDKELVIHITKLIVFNDPVKNCLVKGNRSQWKSLPANKSLFHSPKDCGLPIGNLTSQVFANFYLHQFDAFVTKELGLKYYGRYVDDFIIVHSDKEYLKSLIPQLSDFLISTLQLTLHPKKIYLQHFSKGVKFLGTVIKPNRIYISNRTKGNFYKAIGKQNRVVEERIPNKEDLNRFLSSMNSYLGIMKHYKTFRVRKKIIFPHLNKLWLNYVNLKGGMTKFNISYAVKSKEYVQKNKWKRNKKSQY